MAKPLPKPNAVTRPYWDGAAAGELRYQRCGACGKTQFPPSSRCSHCHADALAWHVSAGRGEVHSCTLVQRAPTAEFKADSPYVIALVDLDEGFRLMLNLRGEGALETAIGDRVRVIYEATGEEGIVLPQAVRDPG